MSKCRLAIVMSHPTQHFAPLYRSLAQDASLEIMVFFVAANGVVPSFDGGFGKPKHADSSLIAGYPHVFMRGDFVLRDHTFSEMDCVSVNSNVKEFAPDVIWLHGYGQKVNWRVILGGHNKAKFIYTSDSNLSDSRSGLIKFVKQFVVRFFLRRMDAIFSVSPANEKYLRHYGASTAQLITSAFPIDMQSWQSARDKLPVGNRQLLRSSFGFDNEDIVILFVGKLLQHKGADDLIHAINSLHHQRVRLLVVGSGPEQRALEELVAKLQMFEVVYFAGFADQQQLVEYFDCSDIFAFTSRDEPYGAVAAESLPFSLPIVASENIGAVGKAILPNKNGLLYERSNVADLEMKLERLVSNQKLRQAMGAHSLSLVASNDKAVLASDIIELCERFTASRSAG